VLKIIKILALSWVIVVTQLNAEPIKVHPSNPHYFLFKGQPTVLITSAEHYGAVINRDFDDVAYFDALKSYERTKEKVRHEKCHWSFRDSVPQPCGRQRIATSPGKESPRRQA
jgi:hypothetical protein